MGNGGEDLNYKRFDEILESDEKKDIELIKEAKEKKENYGEIADWLTNIWQKKYSPEFRGEIKLTYDIPNEKFVLKCGDNIKTFEEDELNFVPEQIKFFRKINKK